MSIDTQEKKFQEQLVSRLHSLTPNFISIRETMGIGTNIGLGFVPQTHGRYTLGTLPEARLVDNEWQVPTSFTLWDGKSFTSLTKENGYLTVAPVEDKTRYTGVVSLYKAWDHTDDNARERFLEAPDEIYEGLIAHELAHIFDIDEQDHPAKTYSKERSAKINNLAREYLANMKNGKPVVDYDDEYDSTDEGAIDVIAARFGYKKQILAKLHYMIGYLETLPGSEDRSKSFATFKGPGQAIREAEVRIKEVIRDCPDDFTLYSSK